MCKLRHEEGWRKVCHQIYKRPSMQIRKVYNPVSGSEENRTVIPSADGLDRDNTSNKPVFSNVAPLIPIVAKEVMERSGISFRYRTKGVPIVFVTHHRSNKFSSFASMQFISFSVEHY